MPSRAASFREEIQEIVFLYSCESLTAEQAMTEIVKELHEEDGDQEPDCPYCRGTGLSPYSIHDVPCRHCGGRG